MKRKVGFMDFHLFKKIIRQIKGHVGFVWLHNFGEPLFHSQLEEFINHCAENNIRPGLSTNATILDEEKARMILDSRLDHILLCIDGSTKERYQRIRKGGDFEETRNNITQFLQLKQKINKTKLFAEVQMIRMEETEGEINLFKKQWKGLADNVLIKDFCAWASQADVVTAMKKQLDFTYLHRKKRYPCMAFWRDGVILWNGDFVPCCKDFDSKLVLGNINQDSLEDIWNSEKIRIMRKKQSEGDYNNGLCGDCKEWIGSQKDIFYLLFKIFPYLIRRFKKYRTRRKNEKVPR